MLSLFPSDLTFLLLCRFFWIRLVRIRRTSQLGKCGGALWIAVVVVGVSDFKPTATAAVRWVRFNVSSFLRNNGLEDVAGASS